MNAKRILGPRGDPPDDRHVGQKGYLNASKMRSVV